MYNSYPKIRANCGLAVEMGGSVLLFYVCICERGKSLETKTFHVALPDTVESMLSDYDILSQSSIQQHSLKKRDLQPETHVERLLSFSALQR